MWSPFSQTIMVNIHPKYVWYGVTTMNVTGCMESSWWTIWWVRDEGNACLLKNTRVEKGEVLIGCTLSSLTFTEGGNELLTVSLDVPVGWTTEAHPVPGMWHLVHRAPTRACAQRRQELFWGVAIASPIKEVFVWKTLLVRRNCMCAEDLMSPLK